METTAFVKLALDELKHGQVDEAIMDLKRAVVLDCEDWEAHNYLGIAFAQKGLRDRAITEIRRACELNPASALAVFNLGVALLACGEVAKARSCIRRALLLDPSYRRARELLARIDAVAAQAVVTQKKE